MGRKRKTKLEQFRLNVVAKWHEFARFMGWKEVVIIAPHPARRKRAKKRTA